MTDGPVATMPPELHPISKVQWMPVDCLHANDYNPNVVITPEMKLLRLSLLQQGWIQPILVAQEAAEEHDGPARLVIIDGFHRATLAKTDAKVFALTGGLVPCCVLTLTVPERMLLTVRINRAKGTHIAAKMEGLIKDVVLRYGYTIKQVAKEIGADRHEVEMLLQENVFKQKDTENHAYTRAWGTK
jgi:ParB-like chromosome segregation protein Spo0J